MNPGAIVIAIFKYGVSPILLIILGIIIALHYQEEIKKYAVWFWKFIRIFCEKAEKKIVSNDIEGRVNTFTKSLKKEMVDFEPIGVQIQWVEKGEAPSEFFDNGRLIIRMRKHQNQDKNFVHASMAFTSKYVLTKAKKYISKSQKESLDLFISKKLFEKEKPHIVDQFFEDFFSPQMYMVKIADLVEKYTVIDKAALFFPVLVQELSFLGEKVFWKRKDDQIIIEVNQLVDFLQDYANREAGEETMPNDFRGAYCRCGITLIGKRFKIELGDTERYIHYIEGLVRNRIENIYIVGPAIEENIEFITEVVRDIEQKGLLEKYAEPRTYKAQIKSGGERKEINSYMLLLRNPNAIRYFDEEYHRKFIDQT